MSYLFLDDERIPTDVDWVALPACEAIIVRTFEEFVGFIEENGIPSHISFDNDLGEDTPEGYDCAKWLIERVLDGDYAFPRNFAFTVHSMNPVGRKNISALLLNFLNDFQSEN